MRQCHRKSPLTTVPRAGLAALFLIALCIGLFSSRLSHSEEPKSQDAQWAEDALRWGRAEASVYQIRLRDDPQVMAKLIDKPVLRWSNPDAATVHGNVFVWTRKGRPLAIASIYKFFTTKQEFAAEFHSLATEPLLATKKGQDVWQPATAGITLTDFPGAPVPASTPTQRLRQMRDLAGQLRGEVFRWNDDQKSDLRLLPTPLYRYTPEDPQVFDDGAVFALVTATDPEAIVVLEAHRKGDKSTWQYGLARMTVGRLRVRLGESEVWSAEKLALPAKAADKPYRLFEWLPLPDEPPAKSGSK